MNDINRKNWHVPSNLFDYQGILTKDKEEKIVCVRCGGTGRANYLTYPDQSHKNGCRLCKGIGEFEVTNKVELK